MLLQLHRHPFDIHLLQIYTPTSEDKYDEEVEQLYDIIKNILDSLKCDHINVIMVILMPK